jgi:hypothetical protein
MTQNREGIRNRACLPHEFNLENRRRQSSFFLPTVNGVITVASPAQKLVHVDMRKRTTDHL